jgi:hypothetical protein
MQLLAHLPLLCMSVCYLERFQFGIAVHVFLLADWHQLMVASCYLVFILACFAARASFG